MKRSPMKRSRRRVNPISADRIAFNEELEAVKPALWARAGHHCERCGRMDLLVAHHKQGRTVSDANTLAKLAALCDACHRHVHANPAESYEAGWMLKRNQIAPGTEGNGYFSLPCGPPVPGVQS